MTSTLVKKELAKIPLFDLGETERASFVIKSRLVDSRLILQVYEAINENYVLRFRIFAVTEHYISQVFDAANPEGFRWSSAGLDYLTQIFYRPESWIGLADTKTEQALAEFLGTDDAGISGFQKYQNGIRSQRLASKHAKIIKAVEEVMSVVPDTPPDLAQFVDEVLFHDSNRMYYVYKKEKEVDAFCNHCRSMLRIPRPKNGDFGTCPVCGFGVEYKSQGKATPLRVEKAFTVIQVIDANTFLYRGFVANRYEHNIGGDVDTFYTEHSRLFQKRIDVGSYDYSSYTFAEFKRTGERHWQVSNNAVTDYLRSGLLYSNNLDELKVCFPEFKYSAVSELASAKIPFSAPKYLSLYLKYPALEFLVKSRFTGLVSTLATHGYEASREMSVEEEKLNLNKSSIAEILALNAENRKILQEINGGGAHLDLLRRAERRGVKLNAKQVQHIIERFYSYAAFVPILELTTFHKATRYIEEQIPRFKSNEEYQKSLYYKSSLETSRVRQEVFYQFRDYIDMCKGLEKDVKNEFILFPRDLYRAHKRAVAETRALQEQKKLEKMQGDSKKIEEMQEKVNANFSFESPLFFIRAPGSAKEIVNEGAALHHCVGHYVSRVAKGETVILFMRKKSSPEKPYITIEVTEGKVIQYRGFGNLLPRDPKEKDAVVEFVNAFEKVIQTRKESGNEGFNDLHRSMQDRDALESGVPVLGGAG